MAVARTREALYNSWDKNDPKDAQVILHMLKTGVTQTYYDPLNSQFSDIQEISKTYYQVTMRKVKVQHSIMTHYLPLYFPEAQKYWNTTRAENFPLFLLRFPVPAVVLKYRGDEFVRAAWDVAGRKVNKAGWLSDFYETAEPLSASLNKAGLWQARYASEVSVFPLAGTGLPCPSFCSSVS